MIRDEILEVMEVLTAAVIARIDDAISSDELRLYVDDCPDSILALIKDAGYVRLDPNQELLANPYIGCQDFAGPTLESQRRRTQAYHRAQQDTLKANFRKILEEEK